MTSTEVRLRPPSAGDRVGGVRVGDHRGEQALAVKETLSLTLAVLPVVISREYFSRQVNCATSEAP